MQHLMAKKPYRAVAASQLNWPSDSWCANLTWAKLAGFH